ncbi:hypothetical protein V5740_11285 [Croceibacterium sp. TMG7-5b_MA50]|uniref:hypothetical protein n=1 Tax=Croceibacterium sp. TMG7-5b_MA50 TaxID=3121290 RepID=UPI003221EBF8
MTTTRRAVLGGGAAALALTAAPIRAARSQFAIDTPMAPPQWAVMQRQLLDANARSCVDYYRTYVDERDWLKVFVRWGANDGPDDAAEATNNWLLLHALGGDDRILDLSQRFWEGHIDQYTIARTVETPAARNGMYRFEFPVQMDWQHNSEGLSSFNLMGLSAPGDRRLRDRTSRFADFYTGADPRAPNYDPRTRVIRSMMNGSLGPLMRPATALDWAGDPFDTSRFHLEHGEQNYQQTLDHYVEYTDVVGDSPLNLQATTLGLNAYALGGGDRFRNWALDYLGAWVERTRANGDILPSNVGPDGVIGSSAGGNWWGGVYGWGFSPIVPQTGEREDRNRVPRSITAFMNGTLLGRGDPAFIELWRRQVAKLNDLGRTVDGQFSTPTMHGADGWYGWRAGLNRQNAGEIWYVTQRADDRAVAGDDPWLEFLDGRNPDYPVQSLQADMERIAAADARRLADDTTPQTRLADWPLDKNPASVKSLVQQMTGGLLIARPSWSRQSPPQGGVTLHCRLRYFDPVRRRAGLPPDCAALVHTMRDDAVEVTLVNLADEPRNVIVQGGAYAEHRLESVAIDGQQVAGAGRDVAVRLAPRSGARLTITQRRYADLPTLAFPWDRV